MPTRVVSTPCWELFDKQSAAYQAQTIGQAKARVAVEAGVRLGWDRFIGETGHFVGMSSFGASAPYQVLYEKFGITAAGVVAAAKAQLKSLWDAPRHALSPTAVKVMLLGSGELGKEVAIELQRLGCEVIAVDRYAGAPRTMVAPGPTSSP